MSPKLARLSGSKVVTIFGKFGFSVVSQRGSHAKLRRTGPIGDKQILTVPLHQASRNRPTRADRPFWGCLPRYAKHCALGRPSIRGFF